VIGFVVICLAGLLVVDVALECVRVLSGAARRRELERDRAAMRRALRREERP
jgi:hypothetical protein